MKRFLAVVVCLLAGFILIAIAASQIKVWEIKEAMQTMPFLLGLLGLGLVVAGLLIEIIPNFMKK